MRHQFLVWLRSERHQWRANVFSILITALLIALLKLQPYAVWVGMVTSVLVISIAMVFGLVPALLSIAITLLLTDPLLGVLARFFGMVPPHVPEILVSPTFVGGNLATSVVIHFLNRARRKSQAAEQLQNSTIAHINDAVLTTDASGAIKYFNPAAATLLRLTHEHIGQRFDEIIDIRDEHDTARSDSLVDQARVVGATLYPRTQQMLVRSDGTRVPVEAVAAPVVRNDSDEVTGVVLTVRDCSEQRRIETVLRERLALQNRLERITSVVPGSIQETHIFADGRTSLHYASAAFKDIVGLDPAECEYSIAPMMKLIHPDDRVRVRDTVRQAIIARKPVQVEHRWLNPQRGVVWASISMSPSYPLEDCFVWHNVMVDITERKRAEERLRASQMQLHSALQAGGMGVLEMDLATGRLYLDDLARQLWGLENIPADELNVEHLATWIHPDDLAGARSYHQELCLGPKPYEREYHLLMAGGQERWLLCKGLVYMGELSGQLTKVGVIVDTTVQRHSTEQRNHSQKLEALGVLAGGIAHDFNNLLLAITGNVRLLLTDIPAGSPLHASATEIDKAATRAADLVRRILSFSSVQEPGRAIQPLPLRPALDEIFGLARAVLPATMTMTLQIPEQLPEVRADSGQLHQVLLNLLTNAADAAGSGKTIDVRVNADVMNVGTELLTNAANLAPGRYVRITVTDNGCGIEPSVQQRIFDPFFTTKPAGRGTGLGLAIVHGIMKNLGGAVTVTSTPGAGSSFDVYFQIVEPAQITAAPAALPLSSAKTVHILYVDDEEALVFLMSRTLERMGYKVTACGAPEQALAKFTAQPEVFDVVVSDMAMPGMSGLELAERMLAVRKELPFIITSGYIDAADTRRAQAVGVQQMILKPNTVDELSATLLAIVPKRNTAA